MQENESNKILEDDLINLSHLSKVLLSQKLLIILTVAIFSIAASFYGNLKKPTYIAKSDIFLGSFEGRNIVNPKIIELYFEGISHKHFSNPNGGFFVTLKSDSNPTAEESELEITEVIAFLFELSNSQIQEGINEFNQTKERRIKYIDQEIEFLIQKIDFLNEKTNNLNVNHDKSSNGFNQNDLNNLASESRIDALIREIEYMNEEIDLIEITDENSFEFLNTKTSLVDLELELKKITSNQSSSPEREIMALQGNINDLLRKSSNFGFSKPKYKFSEIVNEVEIKENSKRPIYFYFLAGAIIGFICSIFLVLSRFLENRNI